MTNHAESPPGCLAVLIPLSAAMAGDARVWLGHRYTPDGEPEVRDLPKSLAARFLADELLEGLANALDGGYPVPLDVAVFGYRANEGGALELISLLPGENPTPRFVPLAEVTVRPVEFRNREGDPRKWTKSVECGGSAPATAALAEVYKHVAVWLTGRFSARPPVVIHCTDGEGLGESYARVARSLGLLATAYGPARLLHVGLTTGIEPTLCGTWNEEVSAPWSDLFAVSAELPAEPEGRPERPAVSINDWSVADAWSALFDVVPLEDAVAWTEADAGRFEPPPPALWTQKMGNTPEQWEDAFATDPVAGVAAVADGASTGIYCRVWADQLAKRFLSDRPDVRDPVALAKWVHGLRGEWRAAIEYDKLNWSKQRKVDETGAAATLLGLEVGGVGGENLRAWRAFAVGDACLFWVRDGKLIGSFPVVAADQFGSAPLLVRSNHGYKTLAVAARGTCEPGDRFLLATDAVAARLFKSAASGPGPEWELFESIDEATWRKDLDALRKANDMVNDDCTLVTLRVVGGEPAPVPVRGLVEPVVTDVEVADLEPVAPESSERAEAVAALVEVPASEAEQPVAEEAPTEPPDEMPVEVSPESNGSTQPNHDQQHATDGVPDPTDSPADPL